MDQRAREFSSRQQGAVDRVGLGACSIEDGLSDQGHGAAGCELATDRRCAAGDHERPPKNLRVGIQERVADRDLKGAVDRSVGDTGKRADAIRCRTAVCAVGVARLDGSWCWRRLSSAPAQGRLPSSKQLIESISCPSLPTAFPNRNKIGVLPHTQLVKRRLGVGATFLGGRPRPARLAPIDGY